MDEHLILGDFNAQHTLWGSISNNYRGNKTHEFIESTEHVILNSGDPTHITNNGNFTHIDVSLATPRLSVDTTWSTYSDSLGSDHIPIIVKIGKISNNNETFSPLCKYKTKNVEWEEFSEQAKINLDGDNVNEKLQSINSSILNAAETSLPKFSNFK